MPSPLLLLSDTHLSKSYGHATGEAMATLIDRHPNAEIIFVGDILDLSLEPAATQTGEAVRAALSPHKSLRASLRQHLRAGGRLTWIPGNHDAGLACEDAQEVLRQELSAPAQDSVNVEQWFSRRGELHLEHGHLFDRDCRTPHPLAEFDPRTEGLGTALMRRFVAPNDALVFAHAHTTTPTSGLWTAFARWGLRAPVIIYNYFHTAFLLLNEARQNPKRFEEIRRQMDSSLKEHAQNTGVPEELLSTLVQRAPSPTHQNFSSLFFRLYFDRIFSGLAVAAGIGVLISKGILHSTEDQTTFVSHLSNAALLAAGVGGAYLTQSLLREPARYGQGPADALETSAGLVQNHTQAGQIIFGHSHVECQTPHYLNLGSFGYGATRPYALVDASGRATPFHFNA
ncbi:MAG: metallophosphoesterase [Polyangiaceae bacterium]|nr:metallophosphoesterase [Polyangiaceae bacterium]